jgi:hypothetical protein
MYEWCYQFVDLPQIPQEFINQSLQAITANHLNEERWWWPQTASEVDSVDNKLKQNVSFLQYKLPNNVIEWFNENVIISGCNAIHISKTTDGDHKGAHTDKTRDYVLMYLIELGGEKPYTVWYQEKNQPVIREKKARVHDYNLLTEIERVHIPQYKWCILNSRIIHGVDSLTYNRVGFQIGLTDPFELRGKFID